MRHLFRLTLAQLVSLWCLAGAAFAQGLIRDADIEHALGRVAAPVLRAAGLGPGSVRVLVVNDHRLNAFVVDHGHIFLTSGLVMKLRTAPQIQAVIAHEAAHIANGHIARRLGNLRAARTAAGLGAALAVAAAAGGAGQAAAGLAIGTASSARRLFFAHTQAEETSADQMAMRTLVRAGIDTQGAVEVMEIFAGQEYVPEGQQDPYVRTHPLSRDRLRALRALAQANAARGKPDAEAEYRFARARAKLSAFLRAPGWTLRSLDTSRTEDIRAMRKAIALHRLSRTDEALAEIDRALRLRKADPYLLELKGQILLESRRYRQAVAVYREAARLAPGEALILGGLGRALLAVKDYDTALKHLEKARATDFRDPRILRDLAVAYARKGRQGMAALVTAERYALMGRMDDAELHARRAAGLLPEGSGPWRRAEDVLSVARLAKKRR